MFTFGLGVAVLAVFERRVEVGVAAVEAVLAGLIVNCLGTDGRAEPLATAGDDDDAVVILLLSWDGWNDIMDLAG